MRLLDTTTGRFVLVEDPSTVRYAILSHVWTRPGERHYPEQTYQDVLQIQRQYRGSPSVVPFLSEKVRGFCDRARADGFSLAWADVCCINKTDDKEMFEAINSMFIWYRDASACYTILSDVDYHGNGSLENEKAFRSSRWFTRGWTLQELIAPRTLKFFSSRWDPLGSKQTLALRLEEITGVDRDILIHAKPLHGISVSRRISWAAKRQTTRAEDEAYSLIGLLEVKMSISYGEGRIAFCRLQEEIARRFNDPSIFVWGPILPHYSLLSGSAVSMPSTISSIPTPSQPRLLAESPRDFLHSSHVSSLSSDVFLRRLGGEPQHFRVLTQTAFGFWARLPLLPLPSQHPYAFIAVLPCGADDERTVGILLRSSAKLSDANIFYVLEATVGTGPSAHITTLPTETIQSLRPRLRMADVYVNYRLPIRSPEHADARFRAALCHGRGSFEVRHTLWSRNALLWRGYEVSPASYVNVALPTLESREALLGVSGTASPGPGVVVSRSGERISIQIGRCGCSFGARFGLLAVWVSFQSPRATLDLMDGLGEKSLLHPFSHPAHISSWDFVRSETATKDLRLDPETMLRLTLFMQSSSSPTKVLQLGAELIDVGDLQLSEQTITAAHGGSEEQGHPRFGYEKALPLAS